MIFRKRNRPFQKVDKNSTVLVLSGNEKEIITLNDTAFSIWNVCDGKSKEEIVSHQLVKLVNFICKREYLIISTRIFAKKYIMSQFYISIQQSF